MNWHTDITIGDLHYRRSKFAQLMGSDGIYLASFNKATEAFYHARQFRVSDEFFLTWAFLTPEREINHILDKYDYLDDITQGSPWIMEAYMPGKSLAAMRELKSLIPGKILRFRRGSMNIGAIHLP